VSTNNTLHNSDDLSESDIRDVIDREARRRHGISGDEFIALVGSGEVDERCGTSADLVGLVRILQAGDFVLVR